mgnify:FL=1
MLAKSDGTTLHQHIRDCLAAWQQLGNALPQCREITQLDNFWDLLFGAVYIHDFGKAQIEFQKVLQGKANSWAMQRHEVYSVPFASKFAVLPEEQILIKKAVLGHHKDFHQLYFEKYKNPQDMDFEKDVKYANQPAHPEDFIYNLRKKFHHEFKTLIEDFDKIAKTYNVNIQFSKKINLLDLNHPYVDLASKETNLEPDSMEFLQNMLFWGALKICDHYGSANVKHLPLLEDKHFNFLDKLQRDLAANGNDFYQHQRHCAGMKNNCLLIAPTGAGKTEAAMAWLRGQMHEQGRVFYVLPFTASINAMHKRLADKMDPDFKSFSHIIGVQHGNIPSYLASYFTAQSQTEILQRNAKIKTWKQQLARMQHPLKVVTPFQLLKYFYGVKGFEMGFTQLAGAKLIFDEIHAYEPATFAQIEVMLDYVIRYLHCRVMIMTATLPTFLKNILAKTLNINRPVVAERQFMLDYIRHRIHVQEGDIIESLSQAAADINTGKRIIIVCNTVQRSQEVYRLMLEQYDIPADSLALLHGRFNAQDRQAKEQQLFSDTTHLLIGTQAIEVSLDINFDVMYTEPAPLDALLQRFGRINRKRKHRNPCPIFIKTRGSDSDQYIYNMELVNRTLTVLSKVDILNEALVQELLDTVYPNWLSDEKNKYENTKIAFTESLKSLQPYSYPKENEQAFYEKFDGIQVLPAKFWAEYSNRLEAYDFIGADQLMVSIQNGRYWRLKENNQIELRAIGLHRDENRIETHKVLVAKCKYDSGIGMIEEREEIDDNPFM